MTYSMELPTPLATRRHTEHVVANPDRVLALRDSIPDDMAKLTALRNRHVLSARHFSRELLLQLFRLAAGFESGQIPSSARLSGRILINAFFSQPQYTNATCI